MFLTTVYEIRIETHTNTWAHTDANLTHMTTFEW